MTGEDRPEVVWQKSSKSGTSNCIEVAYLDEHVLVRDSKDRNGPWLQFSRTSWQEFLHAVCEDDWEAPGEAHE